MTKNETSEFSEGAIQQSIKRSNNQPTNQTVVETVQVKIEICETADTARQPLKFGIAIDNSPSLLKL